MNKIIMAIIMFATLAFGTLFLMLFFILVLQEFYFHLGMLVIGISLLTLFFIFDKLTRGKNKDNK
jgi:ABC-type branched-subunit amino acid transport system permease subunit